MNRFEICIIKNKEQIIVGHDKIPNLQVKIDKNCENCRLILHDPFCFVSGSFFDIKGKNTIIELEESRFPYNIHVLTSNSVNQKLYIGKNTSTWTGFWLHLTEDDANIHIGDNCMFSKNITIWGSDGHAIVDCYSNKVLNISKRGVYIGDGVWISADVILTKNAVIQHDSVVGAGSVVCNQYNQGNIVIAGNPAKIIRENIKWYRGKPKQIEEDIISKLHD